MIKVKDFLNILVENNFEFITGVPCSILKDFLFVLDAKKNKIEHIIATDEGEALGIATGYLLDNFGWNAAFYFWLSGAVIALILMLALWNYKKDKKSKIS